MSCSIIFRRYNEWFYADLLYIREIADHAHAILGFIALIQVDQPAAREAATVEAEPDFILPDLLAVLDSTRDTGFGFDAVVAPAAGAWLLISSVSDAEAAVHSAGSDQRRWDRLGLD